jgi:hypothetical protein
VFDARTAALDDWLDLIEEPLLDRTATILSRQDYRRYGTKGLSKRKTPYLDRPDNPSKQSWLEYLTNQRENVKSRANLLDKYPILAEDLDSPNIRPELKARYEKALSLVPEEDLKTFKALTESQKVQAIDWVNDPDLGKIIGKQTGEVTEVGRRLGGIGDEIHLLTSVSKSGPVKKLLKASFLPVVGSLLAPSIVNAAEERQEENPNLVNWTQLQLERVSQFGTNLSTVGVAGVVTPEPVSTAVGAGAVVVGETIDTAASVPSLLIDAARYAVKHAQNPLTDEELQKEFQKTDDYLGPNFSTL